jgi:hypothetical protein
MSQNPSKDCHDSLDDSQCAKQCTPASTVDERPRPYFTVSSAILFAFSLLGRYFLRGLPVGTPYPVAVSKNKFACWQSTGHMPRISGRGSHGGGPVCQAG